MPILRRGLKWAAILLAATLLVGLTTGGVFLFLLEIPFRLAFGWIGFLRDNVTTMEVNLPLFAQALACVAALGAGGHWFARWLFREMAPNAPSPWRPGWTAAGLAGVLLLFIAGIATIGITHQTAWLFTAKGALLRDDFRDKAMASEGFSLSDGLRPAIEEAFVKTGRFPDSAAEAGLTESGGITKSRYVRSISVGPKGIIRVEVDEQVAGGGVTTFTPSYDGGITWKCRSTLPQEILPKSCRH